MFIKRASAAIALALVVGVVQAVSSPMAAQAGGRYTPQPGVTYNNPLGSNATQRRIISKIVRSIRATPRGEVIRIMSWNIQSPGAVDALLRAQRRGVKVNVLMSRSNLVETGNPGFRRLQRGLRAGNDNRPRDRRSWARVCRLSCRGKTGAAHSKIYLYSRVGRARHVVIQGSANLTVASTTNQWNDIYTTRNREAPYRFMTRVFDQMAKDKPVRPTFVDWRKGPDRLVFFPKGGDHNPDPVMQLLKKVKCRGAKNTSNGRTRLRIAPDVLRQDRGMYLARKLRRMWLDGCNIRIGYTIVGIDVGKMLRQPSRRGPVPMRHLVQDTNDDGQFDNYFHMKSMSIVGHIGRDRSNRVVLNGSSNWSTTAARSDENIGIYWRKRITRKYEEHFNYWYDRIPRNARLSSTFSRQAVRSGRMTDDGLLFGTGPINGIDPYANLELD
jgi:phosphatidylserine/phosphatidylglycerophosphate/cardiolipin synthase-like enzyme